MDTLDRYSPGIRYIMGRRTEAEALTNALLHAADYSKDRKLVVMDLDYVKVHEERSTMSCNYRVMNKEGVQVADFADFIEVVAYILKHWW